MLLRVRVFIDRLAFEDPLEGVNPQDTVIAHELFVLKDVPDYTADPRRSNALNRHQKMPDISTSAAASTARVRQV
jgi:hypothetical protein